MRVTEKGQVTIPKRLREKTHMLPGCEVEFVEDRGRLVLRKAPGPGRGRRLVERMRGRGNVKMTTDQILALTRGS